MTVVRFKQKPSGKSFNNFMDDFFSGMPSLFSDEFNNTNLRQLAPVNVKETEIGYQLEIVAPGFKKEDFKINLENNMLTISAEVKCEEENKNEKQIRREYKYQSFKRSFTIDKNMDAESISAQYVNGVLALNFPKKTEVKTSAKQITIQ